ncbi:hypothetical protein FB45DRAFT_1039279 [Roridomyces roridus]|uniref:Uncharacterized protein n=1 Tax=Roridomyces roridus TaxID=1738132 RepID=A0AAD7B3P6_9AGAR|nr:hypothetical protein FB45DRAFT_1039279 [Roridomyces roridus]
MSMEGEWVTPLCQLRLFLLQVSDLIGTLLAPAALLFNPHLGQHLSLNRVRLLQNHPVLPPPLQFPRSQELCSIRISSLHRIDLRFRAHHPPLNLIPRYYFPASDNITVLPFVPPPTLHFQCFPISGTPPVVSTSQNENQTSPHISSQPQPTDSTLTPSPSISDSPVASTSHIEPEAPSNSDPPPIPRVNVDIAEEQLLAVRNRLTKEIEQHGKPLCYLRGDFYDRPPHPVFALNLMQTGANPTTLYWRDVFVWLPHLLPGSPANFTCTCGKALSRNGMCLI